MIGEGIPLGVDSEQTADAVRRKLGHRITCVPPLYVADRRIDETVLAIAQRDDSGHVPQVGGGVAIEWVRVTAIEPAGGGVFLGVVVDRESGVDVAPDVVTVQTDAPPGTLSVCVPFLSVGRRVPCMRVGATYFALWGFTQTGCTA